MAAILKGLAVDGDDLLPCGIQALMCYDELSFTAFGENTVLIFCALREEIPAVQPLADDDLVQLSDAGL
jgi:hypothetical protein